MGEPSLNEIHWCKWMILHRHRYWCKLGSILKVTLVDVDERGKDCKDTISNIYLRNKLKIE